MWRLKMNITGDNEAIAVNIHREEVGGDYPSATDIKVHIPDALQNEAIRIECDCGPHSCGMFPSHPLGGEQLRR
jgi:hypothetical protein